MAYAPYPSFRQIRSFHEPRGCPALTTAPEKACVVPRLFRLITGQPPANKSPRLVCQSVNIATASETGMQLLYLSEDHVVALYEVGAVARLLLTGSSVPNPIRRVTILKRPGNSPIRCGSDFAIRAAKIATRRTRTTGDCCGYANALRTRPLANPPAFAPTQLLARHFIDCPASKASRAISAKVPTHMTSSFSTKLRSGSSVVFSGRATGQTHTIRQRSKRNSLEDRMVSTCRRGQRHARWGGVHIS